MNKSGLIDFIAKDAKITKVDAGKAVDSLMKCVKETLKDGDKITLVGFGTWSAVNKEAHMGRNPRTQEQMMIPAKTVAKFKATFDL